MRKPWRIYQVLPSLIGLTIMTIAVVVEANPWVEPEYGALTTEYESEQGFNTNYGQGFSGKHYGDDYATLASVNSGSRSRAREDNSHRHGPPYPEDSYLTAADESNKNEWSDGGGRGWGGGGGGGKARGWGGGGGGGGGHGGGKGKGWGGWKEVVKTETIEIHHHHAPKKHKRQNLLPRLKFVPFGVKLIPFKVRVQTPKLIIRKPSLKLGW